jgi:hypothetical protein
VPVVNYVTTVRGTQLPVTCSLRIKNGSRKPKM